MKLRVACSLLLTLAACADESSPGSPDAAPVPSVTYWQTVKPIFDAKCVTCHQQGGIAPFLLDNYADAFERHELIRDAVTSRLMPPWLAADGCTEYQHDRSLSDA